MTESIAIPHTAPLPAAVEQALIGGDLSKLNVEQRVELYRQTCASLGLNPLTKPFEYITLNGKLRLYALRNCTDQLRSIRHVSLQVISHERTQDLYIVTVRAQTPDGRQDEEIGAVEVGRTQGEALANAMMKAVTKAKRRVTLSIAGLSMLDESEVETIPGAIVHQGPGAVPFVVPASLESWDGHVETLSAPASELTSGGTTIAPESATPKPSTAAAPRAKKSYESAGRQRLNTTELHVAIKRQFDRLAGTSQQDAIDIARHVFGAAIDGWKKIVQLPDGSFRRGLQKLEAMQPQLPPEEDVPNHPQPQGTQAPPGDINSTGPTQGEGAASDGDSGGSQELMLPDAPDIVDGYVSATHVDVLMGWAQMYGQEEAFRELTVACPREGDHLCITARLWERIVYAVQVRSGRVPSAVKYE